jgi:hypothetical protein
VVLIIDTNDSGGYGYGHYVGSTQTAIDSSGSLGSYYFSGNNGEAGTVTPTSTSYSSSYKLAGTSYTGSGSLTYNSPWNGFVTVTPTSGGGTQTAVIAGTGLYALRSNVANSTYYSVGMKTSN